MGTIRHSVLTGTNLHFSKIQVISGIPTTTPSYIGQSIYDSLNKNFYVAIGVSSSADWQIVSNFNMQSGTTYTVLSTDNYNTIGMLNVAARAVTLLTQPINGFRVTIKDESGNAYAAPITISTGGGSDVFLGGSTTLVISSEYEAADLVYDLANTSWILM